jgi:5-hydroxyisourate hydrolase
MSAITTHILDISRGQPAGGVSVHLELQGNDGDWHALGTGATDIDGRLRDLLPDDFNLQPGFYRLTFETVAYFEAQGLKSFYPHVVVVFLVEDTRQHYHVPLLLSPFGYSTYRGS